MEITSDLRAGEEGPSKALRGGETGGDGLPFGGETTGDEKDQTVFDLAEPHA